jgi:hypothetical protein
VVVGVTLPFFNVEMSTSVNNWFWEYKICFSCDDSWKLADENLTEQEATNRSVEFVNKSWYYGVAVDVRCKKMELCNRCSKIGVVA